MPDMPLASDPNLDMTGFLYRSLEFLRKELSYSGSYKPGDSSSTPDELSSADQLRAQRGQSVRDERTPDLPGITGPIGGTAGSGLPGTGPGPAAFGTSGQSMAAGVSGSERKPEYVQPLPGPGFTLGLPNDANPAGNYTTQLGFNGAIGPPTSQPQASTQAFSEAEVSQLVQQAAQQGASQAQDQYLSGISNESLEVLEHFGAEAPALLNTYACAVEDVLIEQVHRGNDVVTSAKLPWSRTVP